MIGQEEIGRSSEGVREEVSLALLGGFDLKVGQQHVALPLRVQRLVAFLALRGRRLHRAYVSGRLWLGGSQEQGYSCLRATLWSARRLHCSLIEASSTHVGLSVGVCVDAHELAACAERVVHRAAPAPIDPEDFDRLVHADDLLPDWYEDWILEERTRLHELRVLALEAAAEDLLAANRNTDASIAGLAAVRADPLRESAQRLLIRSYLAVGNTADALGEFYLYRSHLWQQLGLEPSPQIYDLVRRIA
jgi:DNA-binding SARP family transcriptional activator